jgi:hypothetical protein
MAKLLLVPALLLAACADVATPDDPAPSTTSVATPETPASLTVRFTVRMEDCNTHNALLTAQALYPDGTAVANPICQFTVADGTTFDGCLAAPALPTAQNVILTVTDPATGASGSYQQVVQGPGTFDTTFEAYASDHAIHWNVTPRYDGVLAPGDVISTLVGFEPNDARVLLPAPKEETNPSGVVSVTDVGTYQIVLEASISFAAGGGCGHRSEQVVTVFCDGSAHQ